MTSALICTAWVVMPPQAGTMIWVKDDIDQRPDKGSVHHLPAEDHRPLLRVRGQHRVAV